MKKPTMEDIPSWIDMITIPYGVNHKTDLCFGLYAGKDWREKLTSITSIRFEQKVPLEKNNVLCVNAEGDKPIIVLFSDPGISKTEIAYYSYIINSNLFTTEETNRRIKTDLEAMTFLKCAQTLEEHFDKIFYEKYMENYAVDI